MRIDGVAALNICYVKSKNNIFMQKTSKKLASGYKINTAADDAAGLSISEKMRWQIRGLNQSVRNIQDGSSLINVADGALDEVTAKEMIKYSKKSILDNSATAMLSHTFQYDENILKLIM